MAELGGKLKPLGAKPGMSGWNRGREIPLEAAYALHRDGLGVTMHRSGRSAGPYRVANDGRHTGNAAGFAGPGINRKTGVTARTKSGAVRKVRATRGRRWNGVTRGRGTWDQAAAAMQARAGDLLVKSTARDVLKVFGS